jgi:membrane associated rhomboid family serine protease
LPSDASPPLSPEVIERLHRNLVRRKRRALIMALPLLLLAGFSFAGAIAEPRRLGSLAFFAVVVVALVAQIGHDWWALRRTDPLLLNEPDPHVEAQRRTDLFVHEARSALVRPYATFALTGAILAVTAVQFLWAPTATSLEASGLIKPAVRAGEWWRLLTASFMHRSIMHVVANAGLLLMLGRLIEIYNRRLRLPLVYLLSVIGGALLTTFTFPQPAVGASGGILGLAGYLMVIAGRPTAATPEWIRRRMLTILGIAALTGTAAYYFFDNATHAGGAITGALLGLALPPAQPSDPFDRIDMAGAIAAVILAAGAVLTMVRLLG